MRRKKQEREKEHFPDARMSWCERCLFASSTREAIESELERRRILGDDKFTRQRVCAKEWVDFFTEYPTEELNYKFSAECPCLRRNEKSIILIHVDDLIFTGCSK